MRVALSARQPRVTIFTLDCCDVAAANIPQFASADMIRKTNEVLPPESRLVDVRQLHSSSALNVYIFHGAASSTEAKEGGSVLSASGGVFTAAFVKHMTEPNLTLDELSQKIRSHMTKEELDPTAASRVAGGPKMNQTLQISPTENFLQHELRGWCFFSSQPMCCGYFPPYLEDSLRDIFQLKCTGSADSEGSVRNQAYRSLDHNLSTSLLKDEPSNVGVGTGYYPTIRSTLGASGENARTTSGGMMELGDLALESQESLPEDQEKRNQQSANGWTKCEDDTGRTYYWNATTQESQWIKPDGM